MIYERHTLPRRPCCSGLASASIPSSSAMITKLQNSSSEVVGGQNRTRISLVLLHSWKSKTLSQAPADSQPRRPIVVYINISNMNT